MTPRRLSDQTTVLNIRFFAALGAVLALSFVVLIRGGVATSDKVVAEAQLSSETLRKIELANVVLSLCPGGQPVVDRISLTDCVRAQVAVTEPIAERVESDGVPVAQMRAVVLQEMSAFEQRMGHAPTDADVLAIVQQVYAANRPADGRTPTDAELMALILPVLEQNRPADGKDGAPCDPAVNPQCRGPQGVSVEGGVFVAADAGCVYRVTLYDPATGLRSTADAPVPSTLCAPEPTSQPPSADPPTTSATASPTPTATPVGLLRGR